jgi:hypothetical protein
MRSFYRRSSEGMVGREIKVAVIDATVAAARTGQAQVSQEHFITAIVAIKQAREKKGHPNSHLRRHRPSGQPMRLSRAGEPGRGVGGERGCLFEQRHQFECIRIRENPDTDRPDPFIREPPPTPGSGPRGGRFKSFAPTIVFNDL